MESEDKLTAIVLVALFFAFAACAIAAMLTDGGEQPRTEREERIGWECWHDEWADTREAQRRYLETRNAR